MWALLLLAAVFSMHGVQCVAADADSGHGMSGAAHAQVAAPAETASLDVGLGVAGNVLHGMALADVVATDADGGALPGAGAAFWAVCLAVLLTGVVLLGLVAMINTSWARTVQARAPASRWRAAWSTLPRPPDLSALCLLRI